MIKLLSCGPSDLVDAALLDAALPTFPLLSPEANPTKCPMLQTLCLNDNQIGNEGARELAQALKFNTALTNLQLWYPPPPTHTLPPDAVCSNVKFSDG